MLYYVDVTPVTELRSEISEICERQNLFFMMWGTLKEFFYIFLTPCSLFQSLYLDFNNNDNNRNYNHNHIKHNN